MRNNYCFKQNIDYYVAAALEGIGFNYYGIDEEDEDCLIAKINNWRLFDVPGGIAAVCDGNWFSLPTKDDLIWDYKSNEIHLDSENAVELATKTIRATLSRHLPYKQLTIFS